MVRIFPGHMMVLCLMLFCSCTKKVYTHQQVMQGFHNRDDVQKQFGNPDQVKKGPDIEEWTYNRDKPAGLKRTAKPDTIIGIGAVSDTLKVAQPAVYRKYIRFIFDRDGNVAGYKTQGVDMSRTTKDSFGIGLLKVLAITAIVVIVVGLDVYSNSNVTL